MSKMLYSGNFFPTFTNVTSYVEGIYKLHNTGSNKTTICIRQENILSGYEHIGGSWRQIWQQRILPDVGKFPSEQYPLSITDVLGDGNDDLILRGQNGIHFYQVQKAPLSGLRLMARDTQFHDLYGWKDLTLLWGRFYPNTDIIGVLTRDRQNLVKFYSVRKDRVTGNKNYPLWELQKKLTFAPVWTNPTTDIFLTKLRHDGQEIIGLRSTEGLEFFQFDSRYMLESVARTSNFAKHVDGSNEDKLYFGNLTQQAFQDILHLNSSGLFLYKYDTVENDYIFLNRNPKFAQSHGWLPIHSGSMKVIDLNSDGQDDVVFTGNRGLTAISFDDNDGTWRTLMDSDSLPVSHRYVNVVGFLPTTPRITPEAILFTQDEDGILQWAKIIPAPMVSCTTAVPTASTTVRPTPMRVRNIQRPEQIPRTTLPNKPLLRWSEQWDSSYLKETVDTGSGQVNLKLPLIDISASTGWKLQFGLAYNSQAADRSDLVGMGWSLPLATDLIAVDHRGSIFPDDSRYILVSQGNPQALKLIKREGNVHRFCLADENEDVKISYYPAKQQWFVEGPAENIYYGNNDQNSAPSAVQRSLTWPSWRGAGSNSSQLVSEATAWYVQKRVDKINGKELCYGYEQDVATLSTGKEYTEAVRLKSLMDGRYLRLYFQYGSKTSAEYTKPNPLNHKGLIVFPIPLSKSFYLQGYELATESYSQKLLFTYQVNDGVRLLTGFEQRLGSYTEPLLRFSYVNFSDKHVLRSCALLPKKVTVRFSYESITPPVPVIGENNVIMYPVRESVKLAYGPDYVVMVVKQDGTNFVVRILNRSMTKTISEFPLNLNASTGGLRVDHYGLLAFQTWFFMYVVTGRNHILDIFHKSDGVWSSSPSTHVFGEKALIRFSERLVVIAEANQNNIRLLERREGQTGWNSAAIYMHRGLVALVLQDNFIVGYDMFELQLFWRNAESKWQRKVMGTYLGNVRQTLDRFDMDAGSAKAYIDAFNQNCLQVQSNLILVSSLDERNGRLFARVNLFLLSSDYGVASRRTFEVEQETIENITSEIKNGKSTFVLTYVKKDGKFTLRIKSVSGDVVRDVEAITHKTKKEDAWEKRLKELHDDPGLKEIFKKSFPITWDLYQARIVPEGVQLGKYILYRNTGTDWTMTSEARTDIVPLGKHLMLEVTGDTKTTLKLYRQNGNQRRYGSPILDVELASPGALLNRFPAYIAYHRTQYVVDVVTFEDDKTIGRTYTYAEQLLPESDWQNLVTVANASASTMTHSEGQELRVRPTSTLLDRKSQLYVNRASEIAGDIERNTGYKRSFSTGNIGEGRMYSESVSVIPGNNRNAHGWYQSARSYNIDTGNVTKTEEYYDSDDNPVELPPKDKPGPQTGNNGTDEKPVGPNHHVLLDKTGQWLISDFSPYSLLDDMVAYYGFESYENNQISVGRNGTSDKHWRINQGRIIETGFSFTGENYLQLGNAVGNGSSFLEGVLNPVDQGVTYLAACWLRCGDALALNKPVPNFKAIISTTTGQEIIGLLGEAKRKLGEWYYVELPLDFQVLKQIYADYKTDSDQKAIASNSTNSLPTPEEAKFQVSLRVEANSREKIDIDHIRFAPLAHDFQATVYHKYSGRPTAQIQGNGLVTRFIYNHANTKIASIDEEGQIESFTSSSKTGNFVPDPQGSTIAAMPNVLIFEPEHGTHENFAPHTWGTRWEIGDSEAWRIAPGQLWHTSAGKHTVRSEAHLFDRSSAAIRLWYGLQENGSKFSMNWNGVGSLTLLRRTDGSTQLTLPNSRSIMPLPTSGELIILLEQSYIFVWLDGVLLADELLASSDKSPWSSFTMEAEKRVLIEDLLILNRPRVKVEYMNEFGDKTQVLDLEDPETVLIQETLPDELGRESINTKATRVRRTVDQPILSYRDDFVVNKNPYDLQSVWNTGIIEGDVSLLNSNDLGVAYTRIKYAKNPLNQEISLGQPGPQYSTTGPYSIKKSRDSNIDFLANLFPLAEKFRQEVDYTPNGSLEVNIFDKANNQVAKYVRVPSYNHLLSTYEYNNDKKLIKVLPPLYHVKLDTASKLTPWQPGKDHLSPAEKEWQNKLATRYDYDQFGNLIRKTTPDTGTTEYLYNRAGQKRFMVTQGASNNSIVYFNYDGRDQLIESGFINRPLSLSTLYDHVELDYVPYAEAHQKIDFSDDHLDPSLRGRIKSFITFNDGEVITENLQFDGQGHIVSKSSFSATGDIEANKLTQFKRQYVKDKVHILDYPVVVNGTTLRLAHTYNRLGQLVAIGTTSDPNYYANFSYFATGQLATEQYYPSTSNSFKRNYSYNSPGHLEEISDRYLTQQVGYTTKGYGQVGHGDGIVTKTSFNASWPLEADPRWFQVDDKDSRENYTTVCINALKRTGYLSRSGRALKLLVRDADVDIPAGCRGQMGEHLANLLAQKQKPEYYGFKYAYDSHQALTKAKYFTGETDSVSDPLQPDSFATISGLNKTQSEHIWQLLANASYIIPDQQHNDPATAIGKRGDQMLIPLEQLYSDLAELNDDYKIYAPSISRLLLSAIRQRKQISSDEFETAFMFWSGLRDIESPDLLVNQRIAAAQRIYQMLLDKGYLNSETLESTDALSNNFTATLMQYSSFIPDIVQVLLGHFTHQIGEAPFDLESYDIDANGNHRLFYNGFNRYELEYTNGTNQIQNVKLNWPTLFEPEPKIFPMKHDGQGNVVQALHKNIDRIEYHPVSQRTTRIHLTNGNLLRFQYDSQGERVVKRVYDKDGKLLSAKYYLRDEHGTVLADKLVTYLPEMSQQIITAYIYGPRGLLGFIRNNEFYAVTTDHIGSVRLVIKSGRVVAAYDYLPYGELMRSFGNDPEAHIWYRFAGQEYDEEIDMYNFHARLYDPSIGRFYQVDPKAQYFSPYKYAGNSPISFVDPDGELAITLLCMGIGALIGAYLGGAATNNRWNPAKWDFKHAQTWLGIGGGALAGGLLPVGFVGSVAAIGGVATAAGIGAATSTAIGITGTVALGSGVGYLMTAGVNQKWNPVEWKWGRADTWSSMFQGFAAGSGLAGGIGVMHEFATAGKALTALSAALHISRSTGKIIFLTTSYTLGVGMAYAHGVMANEGKWDFFDWDWKNANTYSALIDGFDTGTGWTQNLMEISRGVAKIKFGFKTAKKSVGNISKTLSKTQKLKRILKNPKHPFYKVTISMVMVYFMGSSANGELDITKWSISSFSTYEGIINGLFFGKDSHNLYKFAKKSMAKQPVIISSMNLVKRFNKYAKKFVNMVDNIMLLRGKFEFDRIITKALSSDQGNAFLSKLRSEGKPDNVVRQVETFLKNDVEAWRKGEFQVPDALDKLAVDEATQNIKGNAQELAKWQVDTEEMMKKRQEVFPDREADYLTCRSGSRRRKRATGIGICSSSSSKIADETSKPRKEMIERFFAKDLGISKGIDQGDGFMLIQPKTNEPNSRGFDPNHPNGYSEHLSSLLHATPLNHATLNPNFFTNLVLGSVLSLETTKLSASGKSSYGKMDKVQIKSHNGGPDISHNVLKIGFKDADGALVIKTFVVEDRGMIKGNDKKNANVKKHYKSELEGASRIGQTELSHIAKDLKLENNYRIRETLYYVNTDNSLSVKYTSSRNDRFHYSTTSTPSGVEFQAIKPVANTDIDVAMKKIVSGDSSVVQKGIRDLAAGLLKTYNENAKTFDFKKASEAEFHGFFYGAVALNLKERFGVDIFVERIAGTGYADLLLLPRKDFNSNINWRAKPVVVEFKADNTNAGSAIAQATGTGYLYNLSLRTVADQAIIVGVNSKTGGVESRVVDIPKSEGFVHKLLDVNNGGGDVSSLKAAVTEELQHVYYSVSPDAIKTTEVQSNNYVGRLILGEVMARSNTKAFVDLDGNGNRILLKDKGSDNNWVMLNIVDKSGVATTSSPVTLPKDIKVDSLTQIDIKIDPKSKLGWSVDKPKRQVSAKPGAGDTRSYFFHGVDVKPNVDVDVPRSSRFKELRSVDANDFFYKNDPNNRQQLSKREFIETQLGKLSEALQPFKGLIHSESDFQAVVQGLFMGRNKPVPGEIVKVYPEANLSKGGRSDLIITKLTESVAGIQEDGVIVMELKYSSKGGKDASVKAGQAYDQVYKYDNLKSITDLGVYTPVAVVFDQTTGHLMYNVHPDASIPHPSVENSPMLKPVGSVDPDILNLDVDNLSLGSKRPAPDDFRFTKNRRFGERRKRSLNGMESIEEIVLANATNDLFESDCPKITEEIDSCKAEMGGTDTLVASAGNMLSFFPITLAKSFGSFVRGFAGTWFYPYINPVDSSHTVDNIKEELPQDHQSARDSAGPSPSFGELGDEWVKRADINGLLILLAVAVRKWSGYKKRHGTIAQQNLDEMHLNLSVRASGIVDYFVETVLEYAESSGFAPVIEKVFNDSQAYFESVQMVRKHLSMGDLDNIPDNLIKHFIQDNIKQLAQEHSREQVDEFTAFLTQYAPNILHDILLKDNEWFSEDRPKRFKIEVPCSPENVARNLCTECGPKFVKMADADSCTGVRGGTSMNGSAIDSL